MAAWVWHHSRTTFYHPFSLPTSFLPHGLAIPNARTLTSLNRLVCFLNTSLSHDLSTLASHFRVGGIRPGKTSGAEVEVAGRWLLHKQGRCSAGRSAASLAFAGGWVGGRAPLTPPISSVALSTSVHATRLCSIAPAFCTSVLHQRSPCQCCSSVLHSLCCVSCLRRVCCV